MILAFITNEMVEVCNIKKIGPGKFCTLLMIMVKSLFYRKGGANIHLNMIGDHSVTARLNENIAMQALFDPVL
jgi:hypothetical protein